MVQVCLRITDDAAKALKKLSWSQSMAKEDRVTQGHIVTMAIAALERELAAAAPTAPEDEIRPEVRAAAREAGLDV